jgi:protein involved in polysaccharide export with SLBB domain
MLDRYANKIDIQGAVYRPGAYQLGGNINTVSQLIRKADGLKGDAFTNRALIHREREDLTLEVISVDVKGILNGTAADIELQKNDVLYIPSIHDLSDIGDITVEGEVARPGAFVFADNTTLEDAIMMAGGLLESASTVKIDVTRRIKDASSTSQSENIAEVFTFSFKDGYVLDGEPGFVLQPYDYIYVRRSPSYTEQISVEVRGEVVFPGTYNISRRTERLSDVITKAGGINQWAYVKGARLSRKMDEEEKARLQSTLEVMDSAKDSIDVSTLATAERYFVGIDMEAALANPGSDVDLVLREGDVLIVPQYNNTVKISGNVLYPNTVTYRPDMTVNDFVTMAGGYGFRSKKNKAYIIYMNGTVSRARRYSKGVVEPGCEIVVPKKRERKGALQEVLGVATTASSLATMMATIGNLLK